MLISRKMPILSAQIRMLVAVVALGCLALQSTSAVEIYRQDFEGSDLIGYTLDDGSGSNYSSFSTGADDRIARVNTVTGFGLWTITPTGNSTNFIALEDVDGAGFSIPVYLTITGINISGATGISLGFDVAFTEPTSTRYELSDFLNLEYRIDGGSWEKAISFLGRSGTGDGTFMGRDENLNGSLDGTEVNIVYSQAFTTVSASIAATGTILDVRVGAHSDGSQEEMNFDNIVVNATSVPEPTSMALSTVGLGCLFRRSRRA